MQWHDVQQNTEAWDELRLGKVTASQFSCFMANQGKAFGEPAKRCALQIALGIITGKKSEFSFTNEHMLRGHEQEPIARRLYEETNFVDVTNGGFFDCCNYGDSPDGLVGNDGVIEIKSVTAAVHFETLKRKNFDPAYKWQLIGHLDCTERDWVDFVSYCADFPEHRQLISHRLYRKDCEEEINQLRMGRKEFLHFVATTCDVIEKVD
ncbi:MULTISPECIES: YqaJ viral recombinase family protein [Symbiopectobacterium]|uniref:YqaJ viral recombinase family protein n=1 Tax=Symbiopectobacterium TaxID=801 RepID=UPI001A277E69|nr:MULTISPECIES: YqaJ viral recombinase family protein [Symbiopectobacterium]MBG6249467.1 YqaJ-like viral recombinase [Candidatus Symbiopectobacterium sp. PLON1]MBT9428900.1 YqaJ viral recombinase family protein [Candidatus Symbiopectobacterium endolongispinus]